MEADEDHPGVLLSSASQSEDLGHVLCQLHYRTLLPGPDTCSSNSAVLTSALQAFRAVAWCSGWRAANCSRGFGNNARCDEVLLGTACEDAESWSRKLGLSMRTTESLLEAIHCSAWHCANAKFGNRFDAEEDFQTAEKHWATVSRGAEVDPDVVARFQTLVWNACWCTVNWRSGSDSARHHVKLEQRCAQTLGLCKKAAWAPHMNHRKCNKEMAWKQVAAANHLFSDSLAAIAERGGLKHSKIVLQQKVKKCIGKLNNKRD
ncbi:hypothetical protein ABBQ32_006306 [Trebouxia sp. C0010 RCD-2024]